MWQAAVIALRTTLVTLLLTGIVYPVIVTVLARTLFPAEAGGSLVTGEHGRIVGSELIGQRFASSVYFWPRPSAAGADGYDATASGGSNLGPTSRELRDRIAAEVSRLKEANPDAGSLVPVELVTASGSGLDPHISPAAAMWQLARVASTRGVAVERLRSAVESQIEGRDLGLLGEPRVNVLRLNLLLDRLFGPPGRFDSAPVRGVRAAAPMRVGGRSQFDRLRQLRWLERVNSACP